MARRAALVLGGSGGIGLAVARMLATEGYALSVQGRREGKVEAAVAEFGEAEALGLPTDLSEESSVEAVLRSHARRWGRLDVLVNSAGLGIGQGVAEIASRHLDRQIAINLRAAVLATREAAPLLEAAGAEHGEALIAHVSSWAGLRSPAWLSVYGATKAALNGFARSSQLELAGKGIKVTALCPATVETELTRYAQDEIPPEEMIRPEDVAEAVRFLLRLSPSCAVPSSPWPASAT